MKFRLAPRGSAVAAATFFALVVSPVLRAQSPTPSSLGTLRPAGATRSVIVGAAADPRHLTEPDYASSLAAQFAQLEPENQISFKAFIPGPGMSRAPAISLPLIASWISPRNTI